MLRKKVLDRMIYHFAKGLLAAIKDGEVDIIQGEQEIAAAACARVRERLGIPVVASFHNIWPEELVTMGIIDKSSKQYAALGEIESEITCGSDRVVVVSEEMAKYLQQRYLMKRGHILVVPPGGRARVNQVNSCGTPSKVVYAGLVTLRAHLDLLIESIPIVLEKHPDVRFYITRKGEDLQRIRRLAKKLGVNPEYYWFPSGERFYEFLASCHVGVLPSSNDIPRRMGPAVKLFDYLSVGLPVVANDIGGWTKIVEHEKIGILTDSNPQSFADGMLQLLSNRDLSRRLGERGLELVKSKLNWDESARMLLQKYEDVLR
jgi:glycosyltransferase involved in cell wall biosynthesis